MQQKTNNLKRLIRMIKKILFIVFISLAIQLQAQNKVKIDGVATVVGKNIVLDSEIDAYKLELLQQSDGKANVEDCVVLEKIMRRKLLAHHAEIDSVVVSEAEINQQVQRKVQYFSQQLGSQKKMLEFYGFETIKDMNDEMYQVERENMLIDRERQKITTDIDITPEEVKRYYNSLKEKGNLPELGSEIELAQIVIDISPSKEEVDRVIARLNEIREQVKNGESFKMKTILYSDDPGVSQNSGEYKITRNSPFVKEFKEAAFSLDEGDMSEPFKSDFGYHILLVEKIMGKERVARHLLMQPKISDEVLNKTKDSLNKIRENILKLEITFEEAVLKYSNDKATRQNKGMIVNPQSGDTHFDLTRMDPDLYSRVSSLKEGEFSDVFYEETREGKKMFKFILLKSKTDAHQADLANDYVKIKNLAIQKKRDEEVDEWVKDKIGDTYIKINDKFKDCKFKNNWKRN